MNAGDQQKIVDYVLDGGKVIIFPNLPDREMSGQPCSIIRDALNIHPSGVEIIDSPLVDILGYQDIKCANPQMLYDENSFSTDEVIARNISGNICGFSKTLGKGQFIHLGTWLGFDTEGHKPVYEKLLQMSDPKIRKSHSENEFIIVRERFTPDGTGILFIGNYYNEPQTGKVWYTHPATGNSLSIPFASDEPITWPPLYGVLSPVNIEIMPKLSILHATSDVLDIRINEQSIELTVFGDRDLMGEIVFEGSKVSSIQNAYINEKAVEIITKDSKCILHYSHEHQKAFTINISIM